MSDTLFDQHEDEALVFRAGTLQRMVRDAVRRARVNNAPDDRIVESILREQVIDEEFDD